MSISLLSMEWWLSLPIIAETTGLFFGGEVLYLKWSSVGWIFHSLGSSVGSSQQRTESWFIFLLIIGGRNLGPRRMQKPAWCPILAKLLQILFYRIRRDAITGWRVSVSLLMEYKGPKFWERWLEVVNVVGDPIIYRVHEYSPYVDSQFYVVVKECDVICHLGHNEWFYFAALW